MYRACLSAQLLQGRNGMTIDERLDRLVECHEALSQSVELLTKDVRELGQSVGELRQGFGELGKYVGEVAEGTARLLRVAQNS